MPNFQELLSRPLDEIKRPPALPPGTYFGSIKSYEPGASSQKKTPFVKFHLAVSHAGDDVTAEDLAGIELGKKQLSKDFYLTADAEWRLKEFLVSLGIETTGRTFQSTLPETIGKAVMMDVRQRMNAQKPEDPAFNDVADVKGA